MVDIVNEQLEKKIEYTQDLPQKIIGISIISPEPFPHIQSKFETCLQIKFINGLVAQLGVYRKNGQSKMIIAHACPDVYEDRGCKHIITALLIYEIYSNRNSAFAEEFGKDFGFSSIDERKNNQLNRFIDQVTPYLEDLEIMTQKPIELDNIKNITEDIFYLLDTEMYPPLPVQKKDIDTSFSELEDTFCRYM